MSRIMVGRQLKGGGCDAEALRAMELQRTRDPQGRAGRVPRVRKFFGTIWHGASSFQKNFKRAQSKCQNYLFGKIAYNYLYPNYWNIWLKSGIILIGSVL